MVGRVDGLGEVAPAGQRGHAVLAQVLHGGQHVGSGRQQAAVAEGGEDARVVGGRGAQVEQLPLGAGHAAVQHLAQRLGAAVQLLDAERPFAGPAGAGGGVRARGRDAGGGRRGQAEEFGEPVLGGQRGGGAVLHGVRGFGRRVRVGGPGGGEFGPRLLRGGLPGPLLRGQRGVAGALPEGHGALLGVARGERGAGRVGVRGRVVQPAGPDRLRGLLLDLGEPLLQVADLAAGALGPGGRRGGVPVGAVRGGLQAVGALLLLVGVVFGAVGRRGQRADQVGGGPGAGREGGGRVAFGLPDRGGDPGRAVGGGALAQHGLGGLPRGVQGAGLHQLAAQDGGVLLGGGQAQRGVPVGEFGADQACRAAPGLGVGHRAGGVGHPVVEVGGAAAFDGGAGGQPPGQLPGAALAAGVDAAGPVALLGEVGDALQVFQRSGGEVAFRGEFGAAAELAGEAVDQVGQAVGVAGVGDRAQQQVGEVGVLLDREQAGRLALVGVHLPLVAEEFGVEAEVAEVLVPAVVDLLPADLQVRVEPAGLGERVAEALHRAAPAAGSGDALGGRPHRVGLRDRQCVERQAGAGAEGVPRLGEPARVGGDLAAAPLADLADHDEFTGDGVLPFEGDVAAVVGEQELAQHAGAGAAQGVAVAGQHHREDQLEQHGLAAAVLQEQHAGRCRAARRADRLLLEELALCGGRLRHRVADSAQVEHGVGVARAGRADGVEADPGQLVHGGSQSSNSGRVARRTGRGVRDGYPVWNGRPAPATSSAASPSAGGSRVPVPSPTGTTPSSSSSAIAALPARSRTCNW